MEARQWGAGGAAVVGRKGRVGEGGWDGSILTMPNPKLRATSVLPKRTGGKEPKAKVLKKFRPISLINCSFKIFFKLLNNRMVRVVDRLVASNQTAFIKGRFILESVVATHKIIHEVHKQKHRKGWC